MREAVVEAVTRLWLTGLALVLGLFQVFLALAIAFDTDPSISGQEKAFGAIVTGAFALSLLGGLWFLRSGGLARRVCLGAIVVGLAGGVVWFWMLIPPLVALAVFWFGVVRGGLTRELAAT